MRVDYELKYFQNVFRNFWYMLSYYNKFEVISKF